MGNNSLIAMVIMPTRWGRASTWQGISRPGPLSSAHAFLKENCAACHTPNRGVEGVNCLVCHADNVALLGRQPTAFHAGITACAPCHLEHQGGLQPIEMDHAALARIELSHADGVPSLAPQRIGTGAFSEPSVPPVMR